MGTRWSDVRRSSCCSHYVARTANLVEVKTVPDAWGLRGLRNSAGLTGMRVVCAWQRSPVHASPGSCGCESLIRGCEIAMQISKSFPIHPSTFWQLYLGFTKMCLDRGESRKCTHMTLYIAIGIMEQNMSTHGTTARDAGHTPACSTRTPRGLSVSLAPLAMQWDPYPPTMPRGSPGVTHAGIHRT